MSSEVIDGDEHAARGGQDSQCEHLRCLCDERGETAAADGGRDRHEREHQRGAVSGHTGDSTGADEVNDHDCTHALMAVRRPDVYVRVLVHVFVPFVRAIVVSASMV